MKRDWQELARVLGLGMKDPSLLQQALVHRSYLNEVRDRGLHDNERLEFLGDAVLNLAVAEHLYHLFPESTEGELSQMRAHVVRWDTLAAVAERIGLGRYLLLGKGEDLSGGRKRPSNLAGALEAVIGAVYLDGGLEAARQLVLRLLEPELERLATGQPVVDSKSELQRVVQARWHQIPRYRVVEAEGPDHAKTFTVEVVLGEQVLGRGQGRSKKQAELEAARQALQTLSRAS
ncbi:MAG: ribonuclease III [Dehalococcoidia bacterium]|jgi:ribonuclease-3|nr:ribonuclease III [Dehalococcoidia bacterium]MDW8008793.1 ribonuclease III [Chloroflexota bacterium]